jgi:predicted ester cyclase
MTQATTLVEGYLRYMHDGDDSLVDEVFAEDCLDHVSGQTGRDIWRTVRAWSEATFADAHYDLTAIVSEGDRVVVWFTTHARHVGNAFPMLAGRPVTHREISWDHVHMFRIARGKLAEHWAVRNDLHLLQQLG